MLKGLGKVKETMNNSMQLLKIKPNEAKIIRFLTPADDVISVYEHTEQFGGQWKTVTCLGKDKCPLCKAGKKPAMRLYLAVLDRAEDKVYIFKASKKVGVQIVGLWEEYGDITARDFKILRTGESLQTTYQFFPKDAKPEDLSKYELPDIEALVAPKTVEEIEALMELGNPVSELNTDDVETHDYF